MQTRVPFESNHPDSAFSTPTVKPPAQWLVTHPFFRGFSCFRNLCSTLWFHCGEHEAVNFFFSAEFLLPSLSTFFHENFSCKTFYCRTKTRWKEILRGETEKGGSLQHSLGFCCDWNYGNVPFPELLIGLHFFSSRCYCIFLWRWTCSWGQINCEEN